MNWQILLSGKTFAQTEEIAEVWYNRLNKLKSKYAHPIGSEDEYQLAGYTNPKAQKIALELIERIGFISRIIIKHKMLSSRPQFPVGGR